MSEQEPLPEAPVEEYTPEQRLEAKARAESCAQALSEVLETFQCQIVPMLTQEQVGAGPSAKMLIGTTYGILPTISE